VSQTAAKSRPEPFLLSPMLLSSRPQGTDIPSPHKDKPVLNIISGVRLGARSSTSQSSTSPRPPLAMLDPQSVNHSGEMSSTSSTTSAAYLIGRPISNTRIADIEAEAIENRTTMYVYNIDLYREIACSDLETHTHTDSDLEMWINIFFVRLRACPGLPRP
jgi:hypothetical protein